MQKQDISEFARVCPACKNLLDFHSIDGLLDCGLRIINYLDIRPPVTGFLTENEPVTDSSKDVSDNVS